MRRGLWQIAWLVAACEVAHADSRQDEADLLFEDGRQLMAKQQWARACAKFEQAVRLDPDATGVFLNLGLCNEQLGKYKTALNWFRKAEHRATESDTPMPTYERTAKEHAAAVAAKVATIAIVFPGDGPPEGATLKIDGELVGPDELARFEIDPGKHSLTAEAPGLEDSQQFTVDGTPGATVTVHLKPTRAAAAAASKPAGPTLARAPAARWIAIGGGSLVLASSALVLYERSVYGRCTSNGMLDTSASGCDHKTDPYAASLEANDAHHVARVYGTALAGVGVAALGVAAYLYISAPSPRERTAVVPVLAHDHVGIALVGDL